MSSAFAPPNVLLIVLDTARADAFEPYGAPAGASPVLADLARRGAAYPFAISTSNWTLPSHVSMFTGLLPRPFGFRTAGGPVGAFDAHLRALFVDHRDRVLAEVFRRAGYATAGLTTNPHVVPRNGLSTGFERFVQVRRHRPKRGRLRDRVEWWRARQDNGAAEAARRLDEWLDRPREGRPFFLFANLMEAHSPYYPPKPYALGPVERWRAFDDVVRYQHLLGFVLASARVMDIDPAALGRMRRAYAGGIRLMDDWLGRLFEDLDRRRVLDDTIVVIVSDHGENLGEGHLLGHALSLDQRLVHVPLIATGPGLEPPPEGPFSLAGIPRLLARAAGLADHPWTEDPNAEGLAFAQDERLTLPGAEQLERARAAGLTDEAMALFFRRMACVTDGRLKLVRYGADEALYDLQADPLETADVSASHPERMTELRAALERAAAVPDLTLSEGRPGPDVDGVTEADRADIERHLEELGYL